MSRFAKLFAANIIGAAGLGAAALAMSPAAGAEPVVPPAVPNIPGLSMIQQLATDTSSIGGAVLQTAATALNGASMVVGGAPSTLPVSPIQGAPTAPAPVIPSADPIGLGATGLGSAGLGSTLLPLLSQFGVPGSLAGLTPAAASAAVPAAVPRTGTAPVGVAAPLSALP